MKMETTLAPWVKSDAFFYGALAVIGALFAWFLYSTARDLLRAHKNRKGGRAGTRLGDEQHGPENEH